MIISLQNTYPEKLGKMEGAMGVVWNSLGRRNRINFAGGLRMHRDGNRRDLVEEGGMEGEMTRIFGGAFEE